MSDLAARLSRLSPEERALLERRLLAKAANGIPRRKAGEVPPLSFSQRRVWYLEQLNPGTATYNAPYAFRVTGKLDVGAFRTAVNRMLERHSVLRTRIGVSDIGEPETSVLTEWDAVQVIDATAQGAAAESEVMAQLEEVAQKPFDIAHDVLLRVVVVLLGEADSILLFVAHHIAWDGVSKEIFFRELGAVYAGLLEGKEDAVRPLAIDYGDYAIWQQRTYAGAVRERELQYWREKLAGAPAYLDLPLDKPRPAVQRFRGAKIPFELDPDEMRRAALLSRAEKTTLYGLYLSMFKVFLLAFSGQEDLSVATPFAGRDEPGTGEMIGFFTNTVVLRTKITADMTFSEVVSRVRDTLLGAQEHQRMPMDMLVDALRLPRDLTRMPLAQVNFRMQGGRAPQPELKGVALQPLPIIDMMISKFDMALEVPSVEGESGYLEYNTDLFNRERAVQIPAAFAELMRALVAEPARSVGELDAFAAVAALAPKRRRLSLGGLKPAGKVLA